MANSYNELFGLGTHAGDAALTADWLFQETTGVTAVDRSSNGSDGTVMNMGADVNVRTGPNGWLPSAYDMDGFNDYVSIPSTLVRSKTELSFGIWVQFDSTASDEAILIHGTTFAGTQPFLFWRDEDGWAHGRANCLAFLLNTSAGLSRSESTANQLNDTDWHFIGFGVKSGEDPDLIIDGVIDAGSSHYPVKPGTLSGSTSPLSISGDFSGKELDGGMAGPFMLDRRLTAAEWGEVYSGPEPLNTTAPTITIDGTSWTGTVGTWDAQGNGTKTYEWELRDGSDDLLVASGTGSSPSGSISYANDSYYLRVRCSNDGGYDAAQDTNSNTVGVTATGIYDQTLLNAVAHWDLQERSGTTFVDSIGGYNLPISGATLPANSTDGPNESYPYSFSLDQVNNRKATLDNPAFDSVKTACMWVRRTADSSGLNERFFSMRTGTGFVGDILTDDRLRFIRDNNSADVRTTDPLVLDQWYHVGFENVGSTANLYLNGELVDTHASFGAVVNASLVTVGDRLGSSSFIASALDIAGIVLTEQTGVVPIIYRRGILPGTGGVSPATKRRRKLAARRRTKRH